MSNLAGDTDTLTLVTGAGAALVVVLLAVVLVRHRREAKAAQERNPGPPDWDALPRVYPAGDLADLASPNDATPGDVPALYWWWMERDAAGARRARVVILTDTVLALSGPLGQDQVVDLHAAHERGDLLEADLGDDPEFALLSTVIAMDHAAGRLRVQSDVGGDERLLVIEPPEADAGIVAAVHQILVDRTGERWPVSVSDREPVPQGLA